MVHGRNETELGELVSEPPDSPSSFILLREFSALENVAMPLRIAVKSDEVARSRAASCWRGSG
jgi:hypothetical protein